MCKDSRDTQQFAALTLSTFLVSLALVAITFMGVRCNQINKDSFNECVKATQKPLECRARVDGG